MSKKIRQLIVVSTIFSLSCAQKKAPLQTSIPQTKSNHLPYDSISHIVSTQTPDQTSFEKTDPASLIPKNYTVHACKTGQTFKLEDKNSYESSFSQIKFCEKNSPEEACSSEWFLGESSYVFSKEVKSYDVNLRICVPKAFSLLSDEQCGSWSASFAVNLVPASEELFVTLSSIKDNKQKMYSLCTNFLETVKLYTTSYPADSLNQTLTTFLVNMDALTCQALFLNNGLETMEDIFHEIYEQNEKQSVLPFVQTQQQEILLSMQKNQASIFLMLGGLGTGAVGYSTYRQVENLRHKNKISIEEIKKQIRLTEQKIAHVKVTRLEAEIANLATVKKSLANKGKLDPEWAKSIDEDTSRWIREEIEKIKSELGGGKMPPQELTEKYTRLRGLVSDQHLRTTSIDVVLQEIDRELFDIKTEVRKLTPYKGWWAFLGYQDPLLDMGESLKFAVKHRQIYHLGDAQTEAQVRQELDRITHALQTKERQALELKTTYELDRVPSSALTELTQGELGTLKHEQKITTLETRELAQKASQVELEAKKFSYLDELTKPKNLIPAVLFTGLAAYGAYTIYEHSSLSLTGELATANKPPQVPPQRSEFLAHLDELYGDAKELRKKSADLEKVVNSLCE